MDKIPENCVFNKGITGCGATSLAIRQPGHTILAMPFVGLVDNKVVHEANILGIHGNMDTSREEKIAKYIKEHDTIKIASTYDSIPVVCDTLESLGLNPYEDMFLFVDEYHTLLNAYNFRYRAIDELLDRATKFNRKTFVSATPIEREYWPMEMTGLPEYRIE